ncbi:AAA family ATPase [Candidatus Amesbacteria bacterium]|nr:AAA family ATPase [Candidatus Amesbacteria bacterium]
MSDMIAKISLTNFRNYTKRDFEFAKNTIVIGNNGVGKSNLLEAIYLLATGKSFRADYEQEIVMYEKDFFRVIGEIGEIGEIGVEMAENRKKFLVNQIPRRMIDFVGNLRAVLFAPQDMELVSGSPGYRRRYLDFVITQTDREYRRSLISYEKGLRQRNKLLSLIRDGLAQRHQLYFWDHLLIKDGEYLTLARQKYLQALPTIYDKSIITEVRLKQYEIEEVASATTLVGPHRDDFQILYQHRDVSKYGSRGQQRMSVLKLKQHEIEYLGGQPLLLLDDIFSELDHSHREEVMKLVSDYGGQVIATTADEHLLPSLKDCNITRL